MATKGKRNLRLLLSVLSIALIAITLVSSVFSTDAASGMTALVNSSLFDDLTGVAAPDVSVDPYAFDIGDAELTNVSTKSSYSGWVYDDDAYTSIESELGAIYWNDYSGAVSTGTANEYYVTTEEFSARWTAVATAESGTDTITLDVEITIGSFTLYYYGTEANVSSNGKSPTAKMGVLYNNVNGSIWCSTKRVNYDDTKICFSAKIPITITFYKTGTDTVYDGIYIFYVSDIDQPNQYAIYKMWGITYGWASPANYGASTTGYEGAKELAEDKGVNIWDDSKYQESWYINSGYLDSRVYMYSPTYLTLDSSSNRIYGSVETSGTSASTNAAIQVVMSTSSTSLSYSGSQCGSMLFEEYDIDRGYILLSKSTSSTYSLAGAVYGVFKTASDTEAVAYFITDANGTGYVATTYNKGIKKSGISYVEYTDSGGDTIKLYYSYTIRMSLPVGTYYIKELVAPANGYYSLSSTITNAYVSTDGYTSINVSDDLASYNLRVNKVSSSGETTDLQNALLAVYSDSSCTDAVAYFVTNTNGNGYLASTTETDGRYATYNGTTYYQMRDSDGNSTTYITLEAGTYYVKELVAPDGYTISDEVIEVTLNEDLTGDSAVEVEDDIDTSSGLYFTKTGYDSDGSKVSYSLAGAVYRLYDSDGSAVKDSAGNYIYFITTSTGLGYIATTSLDTSTYTYYSTSTSSSYNVTSGSTTYYRTKLRLVSGLASGTYYAKEVVAPSSGYYALDSSTQWTVTISGGTGTITAKDYLASYNLRVNKVSSSGETTGLQSALLAVYSDSSCTDVVAYFVTNSNGNGYLASTTETSGRSATYNGTTYYQMRDSDGNGTTYITLEAGTYYVKELVAPDGYDINDEVIEVDLTTNLTGDSAVEVEDEKAYNYLRLTKQPEDGVSYLTYSLKGALFSIADSDGDIVGYYITVKTGTGYVATKGSKDTSSYSYSTDTVTYNGSTYYRTTSTKLYLQSGTYTVTELVAPEGYDQLDSYTVTLNESNNSVVYTYPTDTLTDYYVYLTKSGVDPETGEDTSSDWSIGSALYGLYDSSGNIIDYYIVHASNGKGYIATDDPDEDYYKGSGSYQVEYDGTTYYIYGYTNSSGSWVAKTYSTVNAGDYYFEELVAPEGYELADKIEFSLPDDLDDGSTTKATISSTDYLKYVRMRLQKRGYDSDGNTTNYLTYTLANALFGVYDAETDEIMAYFLSVNNGYTYVATTVYDDASGASIYHVDYNGTTYYIDGTYSYNGSDLGISRYLYLPYGNYYVKELVAPDDYDASSTTLYFNYTSTSSVNLYGTINDTLKQYPVSVKKYTSATYSTSSGNTNYFINQYNGYYLTGAVYEIYTDEECTELATDTLLTTANVASYMNYLASYGYAYSSTVYLDPGTYYLKEVTASSGYLLTYSEDDDGNATAYSAVITVSSVSEGATETAVQYATAYEDIDTWAPEIQKYDDSGNKLEEEGITYKLEYTYTYSTGSETLTLHYVTDENGYVDFGDSDYLDSSYANSPFMDADGNIIFGIGTITITEVSGVTGYKMDSDSIVFTLTTDSDGNLSVTKSGSTMCTALSDGTYMHVNEEQTIDTVLLDSDSATHYPQADSSITLIDTVSYDNFYEGKTYSFYGLLYDKTENNWAKDDDGNYISAHTEITVSSTQDYGTAELTYSFSGESLVGHTLVAITYVYESAWDDIESAANDYFLMFASTSDTDETVYMAGVDTVLTDSESGYHVVMADSSVTLTDTVTYTNLPAGTYTVTGYLIDVTDSTSWGGTYDTVFKYGSQIHTYLKLYANMGSGYSRTLTVDSSVVTASGGTITAEESAPGSSGTLTLTYSFNGTDLEGHTLVSVVVLTDSTGTYLRYFHAELEDTDQTVYFPGLDTVLTGTDGETTVFKTLDAIELQDAVTVSNIPAGFWKLKLTLVNQEDDTETVELTTEDFEFYTLKYFASIDKTVTGTINDPSYLDGYYVAYEELYYSTSSKGTYVLVAEHKDAEDEDQTVEIRTVADVKIYKYNTETDEKIPVHGATYELYRVADEYLSADDGGDVLVKTFTTDDDGYSGLLDDLLMGTYYLVETEAAAGYTINDNRYEFIIDSDNVNTVIEFEVDENRISLLPSTGGIGIPALMAMSAALMALMGFEAVFMKRRKRSMRA